MEAKLSKKSKRAIRRERNRKQNQRSTLVWGGLGIAALVFVGFILWRAFRPSSGESIPVMNSSAHVLEGDDPGPYNSDPPTSGPHYAEEYEAGFYDESSPEAQVPYPEGYLVHNLEHGYVIYWYNCALLDGDACTALKAQLKSSLEENGETKLIAFPRASLDVPVVMTTWGQMQRFEAFDASAARRFVQANRNRAPEPNAP